MKNVRKRIAALVYTKVKQLDPKTIVQGTLYDEVSGRVFVTLVCGPRRTEVTLMARDLHENHSEAVEQALAQAINKLPSLPIG